MTAEETLDLLKNSLELLEQHPPIYVRGGDRPHSGEKDCSACGYPLTGCKGPSIGTHEAYVSSSYSSNRDKHCPWITTVKRLKAALNELELESIRLQDEGEVEVHDGPCNAFKPQYSGTDYCTCFWTKAAHEEKAA